MQTDHKTQTFVRQQALLRVRKAHHHIGAIVTLMQLQTGSAPDGETDEARIAVNGCLSAIQHFAEEAEDALAEIETGRGD